MPRGIVHFADVQKGAIVVHFLSVDVSVENAFKELLKVIEESENLCLDLKQKIVKSMTELRKAFSTLNKELIGKETELNE